MDVPRGCTRWAYALTGSALYLEMEWWGIVATAAVSLYVCSSLTLFFFPTLVHKRKRPLRSWRNISHRGGSGEELENTMAAFRHAVDVGTDMLELDVHLTKDGEV
jgi:hypothetical protein